jgi:hypothetical protein
MIRNKEAAEEAREQAILMEQKKAALQVRLLEGRNKVLVLRLEAVEMAVRVNPSEPIGELWSRVNFTKPAIPISAEA